MDELIKRENLPNAPQLLEDQMMRLETERLCIRQLTDKDFNLMSLVWTELWPPCFSNDKSALDDLLQGFWKTAQDPAILTGLIFLRDGNEFCGRVNMQHTDQKISEVGIDLLKNYCNRGYGSEAVTGFVNWYGIKYHITEVKVCISALNTHSTHMFEKLGAELTGEKSMFSDLMQTISENLPGNKASTVEDIKIREYILKLPIYQSKQT